MKLREIASNFRKLELDSGLKVYFSYETPIAIQKGDVKIVSENIWSRTTGKHINILRREYGFSQFSNEHMMDKLSRITKQNLE